jgi:succinate-semialdehyde dehydrogenase/glutarate-semialdehyde dehydrogenase
MTLVVETVNPATGKKLATYRSMTIEDAERIAKDVGNAQKEWRRLPIGERCAHLLGLARALRGRKDEFARLITAEMGKPITQSEAEIEKCAWGAEVYAQNAGRWLEEETILTDAKLTYVTFEPLGTVLSIMPWNFPFWQALRFAIPVVTAGNTLLLKHASICSGSSLALEGVFRDAGFPENCFRSLIVGHDVVEGLIAGPFVQGVSLTGSVAAGERVGALAGANIIHRAIADEFLEGMISAFEKKRVGDPMDRGTDVGPLVNKAQVDVIDGQLKDAISKGAKVVFGRGPLDGPGAFFEPTIITDVNKDMRVVREEVFGPLAPVMIAEDEKEAIRLANDSDLGLGASVWTRNMERAKQLAPKIEAGMVFVNSIVKSDPRVPFGGIKRSGIGRELSKYGLREFVNVKAVSIFSAD